MFTPNFSICIPAYKSKFLKECISSIINQTYSYFEIIVLDDCSPEPIADIVKSFTDERLSYYKNKTNVGAVRLVENWNEALRLSNGDFIVMMGDDDCLEPDYLQEFVSLMIKYPAADVYHCRSKIIDESSEPMKLSPSWPEFESVYDTIWHRMNEHRAQYISDFVYRISTLRDNGGFYNLPLAWGSDDITAYIAAKQNGLAHTNKTVFKYRSNPYTITSTGSGEIKMQAIMLYYVWLEEFLKIEPTNADDKIIRKDLIKTLNKFRQKKKMYTVAKSLGKNWVRSYIKWCIDRKKYDLSFKEMGYSLIEFFKSKMSKLSY